MDDDEFESECMALEAIFSESFRREIGRKICISVEPVTAEGETLPGRVCSQLMHFDLCFPEWVFSLIMEVPDKWVLLCFGECRIQLPL